MSESTLTKTHTYTVDPAHSNAHFWVRHMMISKVRGELTDITGTVIYDPEAPEKTVVQATIQVKSLATGQDQRDSHLKSADFLDVEQFPTIIFQSRQVSRTAPGEFSVIGDLTLHGVTREVTLNAEITDEIKSPMGGYKIGVSASCTINREEFGIVWNQPMEAGGVLVGKDINVHLDAELDRPD